MRRRFRQDPETLELYEIPINAPVAPRSQAPVVWGDLPEYTSPIDGKVISGRRQRRNDLARSECRPYEGREQEAKEALSHRRQEQRKHERKFAELVERTYYGLRDGMIQRNENG